MWPFSPKKHFPHPDDPRVLHGHDLDTLWDYLGFSRITLTRNGQEVDSCLVHFFLSKTGNGRRSFHVSSKDMKDHPFIESTRVWGIGESAIYSRIFTPSQFFKKLMSETQGLEWNKDTEWWDVVGLPQQKKPSAPVLTKIGDKIVKIDFTKKP